MHFFTSAHCVGFVLLTGCLYFQLNITGCCSYSLCFSYSFHTVFLFDTFILLYSPSSNIIFISVRRRRNEKYLNIVLLRSDRPLFLSVRSERFVQYAAFKVFPNTHFIHFRSNQENTLIRPLICAAFNAVPVITF